MIGEQICSMIWGGRGGGGRGIVWKKRVCVLFFFILIVCQNFGFVVGVKRMALALMSIN